MAGPAPSRTLLRLTYDLRVPSNAYVFVTRWRFANTTTREVSDVLRDATDLVRWWPSVYLGVTLVHEGDARGVGRVVDLFTKGWLPYTLRWRFEVTEVRDDGFRLAATGDFEGEGNWILVQDGSDADVTYDWRIRAEKPLLRALSFALKPLFSANHRWAMDRGEESLRLELARRHARTAAEREAVPPPPPATPTNVLRWLRALFTNAPS